MATNKKRKLQTLEDMLERPWCYYCERDFDDTAILISHQKAKHFKCPNCPKRLSTAGGLMVHVQNVHKEQIDHIENAIPGREGVKPEIYGMIGVPEDLVEERRQDAIRDYKRREAQHIAETGNPLAGSVEAEQRAKRVKVVETKEEIRARVAERIAKNKAEKEAKLLASSPGNGAADATAQKVDSSEEYTGLLNSSIWEPSPAATAYAPTYPAYGATHQPTPVNYTHGSTYGDQYQSPSVNYTRGSPVGGPPHPKLADFPPNYAPTNYPPIGLPQGHSSPLPFTPRSANEAHINRLPQGSAPHSAPAPASATETRSNSLPKVPGLPERPAFVAGVSTAAMKSLHPGHQPMQPWAGAPVNHQPAVNHQPIVNHQPSVNHQPTVKQEPFAQHELMDAIDQAIADAIAGNGKSSTGPAPAPQALHQTYPIRPRGFALDGTDEHGMDDAADLGLMVEPTNGALTQAADTAEHDTNHVTAPGVKIEPTAATPAPAETSQVDTEHKVVKKAKKAQKVDLLYEKYAMAPEEVMAGIFV